jgi:hypothetical protein
VCGVCGKTQGQLGKQILKCGKCLAAYYCSADCCLADKEKHMPVCAQMAVEEVKRAAAAKAEAAVKAEAAAKAAAATAAQEAAAKAKGACAVCVKSKLGGNNSCSKCKAVWYCGRACQLVDWPKHKQVCKALAAAAAQGDDKARK